MTAKTRKLPPKARPTWRPTFMRAWRQYAGLTLEHMASILGMEDHTTLSKIERGRAPYSQKVIEAYAKACGCTVNDILSRPPTEAPDLFSVWAELNEMQRRRAIRLIGALKDDD